MTFQEMSSLLINEREALEVNIQLLCETFQEALLQ